MIIGFSGKKQSGKSTAAEFLELNSILGDGQYKYFEMAEELKRFIVDVMDVNERLIYGSDAEKNQLTQYKWKDLPHFNELIKDWTSGVTPFPKNDFMTGRELMQQFGTNICRRMNPTIWAKSAAKKMKKDTCDFKFCCDVRFPDEVDAIHGVGGIVVRFTKIKDSSDQHPSETQLDHNVFNWKKFDLIIDNQHMDINEKNAALLYGLSVLEYIQLDEDNTMFVPYFNEKIQKKVTVNK